MRGKEKIAYLGPEGSYSCLAARALCPEAEYVPCRSFFEAVASLNAGEADGTVLPVENLSLIHI